MKLLYLRGALGEASLLEGHGEAIRQILRGDHHSQDLEKLEGHRVYSFRTNRRERLLFSVVEVGDKPYLLVLDYLATHDYQKSRFLKSRVLSHYEEQHAEAHRAAVLSGFNFIPLPKEAGDALLESLHLDDEGTGNTVLDYYHDELIELNLEQAGALKVRLPAVISGVAGSGKSCVALSLLVDRVSELSLSDEPPVYIYLSKSERLVRAMESSWHALSISKDCAAKVYFVTYETWLSHHAERRVLDDSKALFDEWFRDWAKKDKQHYKIGHEVYGEFDEETLYQEFRICSGFNKDEYLHLGKHQSLYDDQARGRIWDAYHHFQGYLSPREVVASEFHALGVKNTCDFMVVDEAQDLSFLQLKVLSEAARGRSVVYCVDSHQRIFDQRSVRPYLLHFLRIAEASHVTLNITYRCPLNVVRVANEVIRIKRVLAGGITDKHEPLRIEAIGNESSAGHVFLMSEAELSSSAWMRAQSEGAHMAVITTEAMKERAKALFKTPLVFTPEEIKGLEYPVVVTYHLYDKSLLREAMKTFDPLKKAPSHMAKEGRSDERFTKHFNSIYVSYTRSQKLLVIAEEATRENGLLLDAIAPIVTAGEPSDTHLKLENTLEDWQAQVMLQLEMGNEALAKQIFELKLKPRWPSFEAFIAHQKQGLAVKKDIEPIESAPTPAKAACVAQAFEEIPNGSLVRRRTKVAPAEFVPSREASQAKFLYEQFDKKRLALVLKLFDVEKLLFDEFEMDGHLHCLMEGLQELKQLKAFQVCLLENTALLSKMDLKKIAKRLPRNHPLEKNISMLKRLQEDCLAIGADESLASHAIKHGNAKRLNDLSMLGIDLSKTTVNGEPLIFLAVRYNQVNVLRSLKKIGVDLNQVNQKGHAPAFIAAQYEELKVLQVLKELGADLNQGDSNGCTPAHIAAHQGHVEVLQVLKELGADLNRKNGDGFTPAFVAAQEGHIEVLRVLKGLGADLNQGNTNGRTAAFFVTQQGHIEVLRVLKELGADLNQGDSSGAAPAHIAAEQGHVEALQVLKELGADLNQRNSNGYTPVFVAAHQGHIEVLRLLKKLGADLNQGDSNGCTPAYIAAEMGRVEVLRVLKELGADLNQGDSQGYTPAYIAAEQGQVEILHVLKELGADLNKGSSNGVSAAFIAAQNGHFEVLQVLKGFGADLSQCFRSSKEKLFAFAEGKSLEVEHRMARKVEARLGMGDTEGMIKLSPLDIAEVMGHASVVEFLGGEKLSVPNLHGFFSTHVGECSGVGETGFNPMTKR